MVVNRDGTQTFAGENVTGLALDETVLWKGTSLPTGGANEPPAGAFFILTANDGTNVAGWYENTGTRASPTWTLRSSFNPAILPTPLDFTSIPLLGLVRTAVASPFLLYNELATPKYFRSINGNFIKALAQDFTSYADDTAFDVDWVQINGADVNPNATSNRIDFTIDNAVSENNGVYFDLGEAVSDFAWVLRFKIVLTTATVNTIAANQALYIGISDNISQHSTSQDFLGFGVFTDDSIIVYQSVETDGGGIDEAAGINFATDTPSAETRYIEVIRKTATTFDVNMFSDSAYSTSTDSQTGVVCAATTAALRYLKILSDDGSTADRNIKGYIDDIQFYDGITSV